MVNFMDKPEPGPSTGFATVIHISDAEDLVDDINRMVSSRGFA